MILDITSSFVKDIQDSIINIYKEKSIIYINYCTTYRTRFLFNEKIKLLYIFIIEKKDFIFQFDNNIFHNYYLYCFICKIIYKEFLFC